MCPFAGLTCRASISALSAVSFRGHECPKHRVGQPGLDSVHCTVGHFWRCTVAETWEIHLISAIVGWHWLNSAYQCSTRHCCEQMPAAAAGSLRGKRVTHRCSAGYVHHQTITSCIKTRIYRVSYYLHVAHIEADPFCVHVHQLGSCVSLSCDVPLPHA